MQRAVNRPSKYANFELDRKEEFLEALSYILTIRGARGTFTHEDLREAYYEVCNAFSLPPRSATKVAREIESHTGLILEAGRDVYEYAHKSLQEFLAAQYISRLPRLPNRRTLLQMPSELAVAVVLSSGPSLHFSTFVRAILVQDGLDVEDFNIYEFSFSFLSRVILERAEFQPSTELAAAVIILLAYTYQNRPSAFEHEQRNSFEILVRDFLRLPGVLSSFNELSGYFSFRKTADGHFKAEIDYYFLERNEKHAYSLFRRAQLPGDLIVPAGPFLSVGLEAKPLRRGAEQGDGSDSRPD